MKNQFISGKKYNENIVKKILYNEKYNIVIVLKITIKNYN
jgi:hypothetical protein